MIQSLNAALQGNPYTIIMLSVLGIFLGIAIATKLETKWGYILALLAGALILYTLQVNGIFSL